MVVQGSPNWWIKLGDFGLSKRVTDDSEFKTFAGSQGYIAPEIQGLTSSQTNTLVYTKAVDIWAVGTLLHRMIAGRVPFSSFYQLLQYIQGQDRDLSSFQDLNVGAQCKDLVRGMLMVNPQDRPTASQALKHEWMDCGKFPTFTTLLDSKINLSLDLPTSMRSNINPSIDTRHDPSENITLDGTSTVSITSVNSYQTMSHQGICNDTLASASVESIQHFNNDRTFTGLENSSEYGKHPIYQKSSVLSPYPSRDLQANLMLSDIPTQLSMWKYWESEQVEGISSDIIKRARHPFTSKSILFHLIQFRNLLALRSLLRKYPSLVNQSDRDGYLPLHRAMEGIENTRIILILLKAGASVDGYDMEGRNPCTLLLNSAIYPLVNFCKAWSSSSRFFGQERKNAFSSCRRKLPY